MMAKSVVSVRVIAPIVIAVVPALVTVTVLAALVVFTSWLAKLTGAPATVTAVPDPVNEIVEAVWKKPLVLMVTVPVALPDAVGAK